MTPAVPRPEPPVSPVGPRPTPPVSPVMPRPDPVAEDPVKIIFKKHAEEDGRLDARELKRFLIDMSTIGNIQPRLSSPALFIP